ncbi:MAG: stage III sporulation protein AB [Eubacteriales bacterium]|nr:stage III sporulation protein AB [Eubacteriales bacterium]
MLKAAGLILIVCSCTGLGFSMSLGMTRRMQALEAILRMVVYLKGEISYGGASLFDAFTGAGGKLTGECRSLCLGVSQALLRSEGSSFGRIFRDCAKDSPLRSELSGEEEEGFLSLGERLGYLDLEMQKKQLAMYEQELSRQILLLKGELPGKKKVYQSLGLLGGLLLAVLVW